MSSEALLEAVRALRVAEPDIGVKPLLAKLRKQQPGLETGSKEVREVLTALKDESKAEAAETAAPPAPDEGGVPGHAAVSLACVGCARLPSDMDDGREKHPVCPKCVTLKMPTTYFCGPNCPGNPQAWKVHAAYHKELTKAQEKWEDGGATQQQACEVAEWQARHAAQTGSKYDELMAEGARYVSKLDGRRAARAYREAIALAPDGPAAHLNLGAVLANSGHVVEAAQRFLEAKERYLVGSDYWAEAMAAAFETLLLKECVDVAKPEWWNDEGLKALSARVLRAAPNDEGANFMRAIVLRGQCAAWEAGARSAAELMEAAAHYERAAALCDAPAVKAEYVGLADLCRRLAGTM